MVGLVTAVEKVGGEDGVSEENLLRKREVNCRQGRGFISCRSLWWGRRRGGTEMVGLLTNAIAAIPLPLSLR